MYTVEHTRIDVKVGERIQLVFTITDADGISVDLSDATATYKIGRKPVRSDIAASLTKTETDGIVFIDDTANVTFDVSDILDSNGRQLHGVLWGELYVEKDDVSLCVAQGEIEVSPRLL